jgi:phenylalanine/tyrosine ammonia-lyase
VVLPREVEAARVAVAESAVPVPNRIRDSRSFPLYRLVREELGCVFTGEKLKSPGEECNKVFIGISEGKLVDPCSSASRSGTASPCPSRRHHLSVHRWGIAGGGGEERG